MPLGISAEIVTCTLWVYFCWARSINPSRHTCAEQDRTDDEPWTAGLYPITASPCTGSRLLSHHLRNPTRAGTSAGDGRCGVAVVDSKLAGKSAQQHDTSRRRARRNERPRGPSRRFSGVEAYYSHFVLLGKIYAICVSAMCRTGQFSISSSLPALSMSFLQTSFPASPLPATSTSSPASRGAPSKWSSARVSAASSFPCMDQPPWHSYLFCRLFFSSIALVCLSYRECTDKSHWDTVSPHSPSRSWVSPARSLSWLRTYIFCAFTRFT